MARKDISDKQVCKAYSESKKCNKFPYELLTEWTGQPEKVCISAMERAYDRGYIEYGVSLRSGWLSEKGLALLKDKSTV